MNLAEAQGFIIDKVVHDDHTTLYITNKEAAEEISESLKEYWPTGRGQVNGPCYNPGGENFWTVAVPNLPTSEVLLGAYKSWSKATNRTGTWITEQGLIEFFNWVGPVIDEEMKERGK